MENNKIKVIAGILLVFFLGVIIGALGHDIYMHHKIKAFGKEGPLEKFLSMRRLTDKLDLTPPQQTEIKKIVDDTMTQLDEFKEKHRPFFDNIVENCISSIKERLNPEQKQKMDKLYERLKQRRDSVPGRH